LRSAEKMKASGI